MLDGLSNVFKRIDTIKGGVKSISNFSKPEAVKEFEERYNEITSKKEVKEDPNYHPFVNKNKKTNTETPDTKVKIDEAIKKSSKKYNVSEDLIRSVIKVESNYDQYGVSRAGAMGLMQLMPQTALELGVEKPFDIDQNIDGGTKYLKMMLNKYDSDLEKSLAAYNAGPHRVDEADGIPDIEETQLYVRKIKNILFK